MLQQLGVSLNTFFPVALMRHRAMTHFTFQCHFSLATALTLTEDGLGKSNKSSSQSLKQNRSVPINWWHRDMQKGFH